MLRFQQSNNSYSAPMDDENVVYDLHRMHDEPIRASMPPRLLRSNHYIYYFPITCARSSPPYPVITLQRREYIIFECCRCSALSSPIFVLQGLKQNPDEQIDTHWMVHHYNIIF